MLGRDPSHSRPVFIQTDGSSQAWGGVTKLTAFKSICSQTIATYVPVTHKYQALMIMQSTFMFVYKSILLRVIWESTQVSVFLCLISACKVLINP